MTKMKPLNILVIFILGLLITGAGKLKENAALQEKIIRTKVKYEAAGIRDPFVPLVQVKGAVSATGATPANIKPLPVLTLQGLVWGGDFPQAIINNKLVRIGDIIAGVEVVAIGKDGVIVLYANKKYKLSTSAVTGPRQKE